MQIIMDNINYIKIMILYR